MKVLISLAVAVLVLLLALLIGTQRKSISDSSTNDSSSISSRLSQRRSWPVEKVPGRSSVADIEFVRFDFERFAMSSLFLGERRSEESVGVKVDAGPQPVTPELMGTEVIATVKFEAVDQHGTLIGVIPMLQRNDVAGDPLFYGVMLIPDRPFRVVASGLARELPEVTAVHLDAKGRGRALRAVWSAWRM